MFYLLCLFNYDSNHGIEVLFPNLFQSLHNVVQEWVVTVFICYSTFPFYCEDRTEEWSLGFIYLFWLSCLYYPKENRNQIEFQNMRRLNVRQRPLHPTKRIHVIHLSADGSFTSENGDRVTADMYELEDCVSLCFTVCNTSFSYCLS